jgi:RNA polymerase sigma factor (sigma-70 family)
LGKRKEQSDVGLSDAILWRKLKKGDSAAFAGLSKRHYQALFNYGLRFSSDRAFVLDCIQELLLYIWEHRETLSETEYVKSYLLKSLRHRIFKEGVRMKKFRYPDGIEFGNESDLPIEDTIVMGEWQMQLMSRLRHMLGSLSKRQQEIIYLRFYQNLDNSQISQIMGLNKVSVANLLYKTLKSLRDSWTVSDFIWIVFISFV